MMTVRFSSFSSRNSAMIWAPVFWSSAPVGSSASRMDGFPTIARAIATRCCCPPDSWLGRWSIRSASPTRSSIASARSRRSFSLIPV